MPSSLNLAFVLSVMGGVVGGMLLIFGYQVAGRVGLAGQMGQIGPRGVFFTSLAGFATAVVGLTLVSTVVKEFGAIYYFLCLGIGGALANTLLSQVHTIVLKRKFIPWVVLKGTARPTCQA